MASLAEPRSPGPSFRRYRAPKQNDQALVDPTDLAGLAEDNRQALATADLDFGGRSLAELSRSARGAVAALAYQHTRAYCDLDAPTPGRIILSGHQPELFHAGVWFKNRVLDRVAKQTGAVGIHLLIDSDLCRSTALRVPVGPVDRPRWEMVPFDRVAESQPYEERRVVDRDRFNRFGDGVVETLGGLVADPLIASAWPAACEAAESGRTIGESLSRARHLVERRWGGETLEVPFSSVCDTRPFQEAIAFLLGELDRVHAAYNASLAEYRVAHRLRSPAQPLPDLHRHDEWLEAPLWVWTADDPSRRPLYARRAGDELVLSDRGSAEWRLPVAADQTLADAVDRLAELRAAGVKVRPRALITTLFARLLLGDLFLHGIGGAKYDQVTDGLCRRWLGVTPPPHATVTATLRLPIDHPRVDHDAERRLRLRLRELLYHPERFLTAGSEQAAPLVEAKRAAIATPRDRGAERHRAIVAANRGLYRFVANERQQAAAELELTRRRLSAAAVLDSREYSFCLFPEQDLRERFDTLLEPV
ncbi:MAG: hypothetical protein AAF596_00230 [Planctomycetota bacterium]